MGLVVPSYVTIRSIEELNEHKEKFRNEIIGIDVGAGLMNETERVIREYPVELTLKPSSGATNGRIPPEIDRKQGMDRSNRLDSSLDVLPLRPEISG